MNPITHGLLGWCVSQRACTSRRDMALVTVAALAPDLDGLAIVADVLQPSPSGEMVWYSTWHHVFGHNLVAAAGIALLAGVLARERGRVALWAFLQFHLHLLCDLVGSRGPDGDQWPIPYLYPFQPDWQWVWAGQWEVNAWPNLLFTGMLLLLFFRQARDQGFSPLWFVSDRADAAFVATLRNRFPLPS